MLQNKLHVFCCTFYYSLKGRVVEDNRTSALKLDTLRPKDIYDQVFALSNEMCESRTNQDSRFLYACVEVVEVVSGGRGGNGSGGGGSLFMSTPFVPL